VEEDLQKLVQGCVVAAPTNGLTDGRVAAFCRQHGLNEATFEIVLARHVAVEFVYGEISYDAADCVMNALSSRADPVLSGVPLEIYLAFDAGEYRRAGAPDTLIPWQQYTLPAVMEIAIRENWVPRA
jgi:hypothetical protein